MRVKSAFVGLCVFLVSPVHSEEASQIFKSPSERFNVQFMELGRKELGHDCGGDWQITYDIIVLDHDGEQISNTKYVYTFFKEEKSPTITMLSKKMIWSPKEDFVLLPPEPIPCNSSIATDPRTVVNLNPANQWTYARKPAISMPIEFDGFFWGDDFTLYGSESTQDGPFTVRKFDGRKGTESLVFEAESGWGYNLVGLKNEGIVIAYQTPGTSNVDCKLFDFHGKEISTISCPQK